MLTYNILLTRLTKGFYEMTTGVRSYICAKRIQYQEQQLERSEFKMSVLFVYVHRTILIRFNG